VSTLVGIDHSFSFPLRYFEVHRLKPIGLPSSMTSSAISQPTRKSTLISFVTASEKMAVRAQAMPVGGGLTEERSGSANRYLISTFSGTSRQQNQIRCASSR
jgi:hypothetical protein